MVFSSLAARSAHERWTALGGNHKFFSIAWAQAGAPPQPSIIEQSIPFILIVFVFYWFIIRPAQRRQKTQASFITTMKRGDAVITSGGILGHDRGNDGAICHLRGCGRRSNP